MREIKYQTFGWFRKLLFKMFYKKLIGVDSASPEGDYGCKVVAYILPNGKTYITEIKYLDKYNPELLEGK